jgi:iron(III) transport system substrate-binding protein
MQRLSQRGLLEPYPSPAAAPFPPSSHPVDHSWQAFAARARVLIVNKKLLEVDAPKSLSELGQPKWHHRFAMAKPFFGSTATHMACLWAKLGPEAAKGLFANLAAQAIVLPGNSNVAQAVADGKVEVGLTDTDDAMEMSEKGKPVRIAYLDQPEPGTLFLPNTLGLIKNAQHPDLGKKLIDFLLSPEVEKRLAEGPSAQIPLNPQVKLEKPRLTIPANINAMQVDYAAAAQQWEDVQSALRQAFRE